MKKIYLSMALLATLCSFAQVEKNPNNQQQNLINSSNTIRNTVWEKYIEQLKNNPKYNNALTNKKITYDKATMRFEYSIIGKPGKNGYPLYIALHGGGSTPLNESQWKQMQVYYKNSVENGIYVATRGVRDTWNTHFNSESYALYDLLIELMIAFKNVDPNRVYIMGFSAGGDGTYNLAPSMADRWAGAAMSAGHHNGISPKNLFHVPMLLQVGENDQAYNRNLEAARYNKQLDILQAQKGGYIHDCYVHYGRGHNFYDNHPGLAPQTVMANPTAWLEKKDQSTKEINTNSITWLNKFTRDPYPTHLIWNLETIGERRNGEEAGGTSLFLSGKRPNQFYWLDIGNETAQTLGCKEIEVILQKQENTINIIQAKKYLKLLLNEQIINFSNPIKICINNQILKIEKLTPSTKIMEQTLLDRGDPNYMFSAEIILEETNGVWQIKNNNQ